jgi:archaeosine synthase
LFNSIISTCPNRNVVHELIVTSPLGLVPRELEMMYPAAHYDISVIGHWEHDEITMINTLLKSYLAQNTYDTIISHLPPGLSDLLQVDTLSTCTDHPTSEKSLETLKDALVLTKNFEKVKHTQMRHDAARSMLRYQFGDPADEFISECTIKGKYPTYKMYYQNKQIASFPVTRGLFSLTFPGGYKMGRHYWVEIDDFVPKGSVFAIGVLDADRQIRAGDDVVVFHNDDLRGVGVACMNAYEMIEGSTGEAVKIRHYK